MKYIVYFKYEFDDAIIVEADTQYGAIKAAKETHSAPVVGYPLTMTEMDVLEIFEDEEAEVRHGRP